MNIYEKLLNIQQELKAPKNQFNSFGKYNYRSCEDILEGLKPLLVKYKAILLISDEIEQIGDRYYIKAIATLADTEKESFIVVQALAREEVTKKGMDSSQITGSTSSYARKYALNGLFAIDDTKDSDGTNNGDKPLGQAPNEKPTSTNNKDNGNKPKSDNKSGFKCSGCSKDIAQGVKEFSTKKFGKPLCYECQKKQ